MIPQDLAGDLVRARLEREARLPRLSAIPTSSRSTSWRRATASSTSSSSTWREGASAICCARGRCRSARWLPLAAQLAEGLAKAHAAGIVHRDLKPENVMVTPEDLVKILDFGLARLGSEPGLDASSAPTDVQLTQPGQLLGTLAYMSPEQASSGNVDFASDQFAGCQCSTSSPRVAGHSIARRPAKPSRRSCRNPRSRSAGWRRSCPLPCARPWSGAWRRHPQARFGSTRELAAALRAVQQADLRPSVASAVSERRGLRFVAALVAVVALTLVAWLAMNGRLAFDRWRAPLSARVESLAVLPLANLSGDPEQDFFADGMTEALITDLARIRSLRVVSRTSVMQYKRTTKPLPQIARELGVDAILEGSIQRAGERVRITAQLIRGASDRHLWAESYERDLRDVLSLQSDVSRAVARAVAAALTPEERERLSSAKPVDPEAYEDYLRAIELRTKATEADIRAALVLFERAAARDPGFAEAHRRVCDTYWVLGFTGWGALPPREAQPRAQAACREALKLDQGQGGAHAVLGSMAAFMDWDARAAEAAFQRAVALSPSDAVAMQRYSWFLSALGRHDEAVAVARRALAVDPTAASAAVNLGWILYWARQYDASGAQLQDVLRIRPESPLPSLMLAVVYLQEGRAEQAALRLERALQLAGSTSSSAAQLAHAYAVAGRTAQAERLRAELFARSRREYIPSYWMALVEHGLGRDDAALARLDQAFEDREALPILEVEPRWDGLRSNPRFQQLLRRVGFSTGSGSRVAR